MELKVYCVNPGGNVHPDGVVQEQMPPLPGLPMFTLLSPFAHAPYLAVHAGTQPPAINGVVLQVLAGGAGAGGGTMKTNVWLL